MISMFTPQDCVPVTRLPTGESIRLVLFIEISEDILSLGRKKGFTMIKEKVELEKGDSLWAGVFFPAGGGGV